MNNINNIKGEGAEGEGDTDRSVDKSKPAAGQAANRSSIDAERPTSTSASASASASALLNSGDPSHGISSALAAMALRRERANGTVVTQHRMAKFTKALSAPVVRL